MAPQIIGHYEVLGKVGQGGMGTVYKARDIRLERVVALKFLNPELTDSKEARARFLREGRALSSLSHPNIATMYEAEELDHRLFLALEYLPGGTLRSRIKAAAEAGTPLEFRKVIDWGCDIALGLAHAHRHGVVHRDVKPTNAMFDEEGRLKLTDFGLARSAVHSEDALSTAGNLLGTYTHMAPEVIAGERAGPEADVYALGVLLYELATCQLPFSGHTPAEVLNKVMNRNAEPPSKVRNDLPAAFDDLVIRLLDKQPARRKDAEQAGRELKALAVTGQDDQSTVTQEIGWRTRLPRRRILAGVLAVLFILMLAGSKDALRWIKGQRLPTQKQVAVLPFRSIGGDASQQAFCDGLTETVATALSKHGEFSVVPASETRGLDRAEQARKEFGVNLVVSGSLQPQPGNQVRLIVTLIDAEKRRQIDSQPIDWPASKLYELEDGVMVKIGDLLNLVKAPEPSPLAAGATQLPAAYDAYLRGRGYLYRYDRPGYLELAVAQFQQAVVQDPQFAAAHAALGEAHLRAYRLRQEAPRLEAARAAAERSKQLSPSLASARTVLGAVLVDLGREWEAAAELEAAVRLDPRDAGVYRELGRLYGRMGRHEEAERVYLQGVSERRFDWLVATYAASYYVGRQRFDEAEKLYRKAIELSPDNYAPRRNLGTILIKVGRHREGEQELLRAQGLNPTAVGYSNLAALYMLEKRYREAVPMARSAAENAPRDSPTEYRIWGNLGDAYWLSGAGRKEAEQAWSKAAEMARAQAVKAPRDARVLALLAKYEAKLGQAAQAVRDIDEARRRDPANADVRYQAAQVYMLVGRREDALREVSSAVELRYPVEELRTAPELEPLRADSRFQKLISSSQSR